MHYKYWLKYCLTGRKEVSYAGIYNPLYIRNEGI